MTDNELLLAISNMMDHKLKGELAPLKKDVQNLTQEVQQIKRSQTNLEEEVQQIRWGQEKLEKEVQQIKQNQERLEEEINQVKQEVQQVKQEVQQMGEEVQQVKQDVRKIKICQENIILPRLNTIEACYTDTYKRYRDNADKMDIVYRDVELLKTVVTEHSEKLQKLA